MMALVQSLKDGNYLPRKTSLPLQEWLAVGCTDISNWVLNAIDTVLCRAVLVAL